MDILGIPVRDMVIPGVFVLWLIANLWIFPKLGIHT